MLSTPVCNSFHITPPLAGATGRFSDSESSTELINHLNTHKSAIAIFVDMLISNIGFHLDAPSQRHHCHLGGPSYHRATKNFSIDYIHPTWWSPWDHQNPHKYFLETLEILQNRRNASQVYQTWGSEAAHRVIRQNLALFPTENDIQDETLLRILKRECTAVLNENNTVFVDLHNRIIAYQLSRQQKQRLIPIAEEPFDAEPAARTTATVTTSIQQNTARNASCEAQQTLSPTYRWSDFDSDDEELPDISDFLPTWVHPTPVPKVEPPTSKMLVKDTSVLEEDTEFNGTVTLSVAAGEDNTDCRNGKAQSHHESPRYVSSNLTSISEEPEDDEEDLSEIGWEIPSDDNTSTSSIPPRTPVDLEQHLISELLVDTPSLQDPLSTSYTDNLRSGILEIGNENDMSRRHGKYSKLDMGNMPLDMERVERWASCVSMIEPLFNERL